MNNPSVVAELVVVACWKQRSFPHGMAGTRIATLAALMFGLRACASGDGVANPACGQHKAQSGCSRSGFLDMRTFFRDAEHTIAGPEHSLGKSFVIPFQ